MNRFDFVKYDDTSKEKINAFKAQFQHLEAMVDKTLLEGRAKSLVLSRLEEAYMWIGKSIRDEQVLSRQADIQEERVNL